jgi:hypothetical protein
LSRLNEIEELEKAIEAFVNIARKDPMQYGGLEHRLQQLKIDIENILDKVGKHP